ncbi:hypothetical protein FRC15_006285 [Serendipita sp. 397]|nr:hypothetical protein FRC15_006285 [Serendipita sp. 397]
MALGVDEDGYSTITPWIRRVGRMKNETGVRSVCGATHALASSFEEKVNHQAQPIQWGQRRFLEARSTSSKDATGRSSNCWPMPHICNAATRPHDRNRSDKTLDGFHDLPPSG